MAAPTWITTASGRMLDPFAPRREAIVIEDIAHALGAINRFNGHTSTPYSVAQHSVHVSFQMMADGPEAGLIGLLHDASEAYLCDVPRPLKHSSAFEEYRRVEAQLQALIFDIFGLHPDGYLRDLLHLVDRRMLRTEQQHLMPPAAPGEVRDDVLPFSMLLTPWSVDNARARFLDRFRTLRAAIAGQGPSVGARG